MDRQNDRQNSIPFVACCCRYIIEITIRFEKLFTPQISFTVFVSMFWLHGLELESWWWIAWNMLSIFNTLPLGKWASVDQFWATNKKRADCFPTHVRNRYENSIHVNMWTVRKSTQPKLPSGSTQTRFQLAGVICTVKLVQISQLAQADLT